MAQPLRTTNAILTTVMDFPERGVGGDPRYRGNWGANFVETVLRWIGEQTPVRRVNEVFTGSGTTIDVGDRLGITVDGRDLNPNPRRGVGGWDAQADFFDEGCDILLCHPPYWRVIPYSGQVWGEQPDLRDLSRIPTWEAFVQAMNKVLVRHYPTIRVGGYLGVLVGDVAQQGRLYSMQHDIAWIGRPVRTIIKIQRNYSSLQTAYRGSFIPIEHEYLLLFQRDDAYIQPVSWSVSRNIDLREREAQTWRDVVYAALRVKGGQSGLPELYGEIEGHAKTRTNPNWQAKIRQTLQINRDFAPLGGGQWKLAA